MSDRLKDLELELRDVIVAIKDVAGTQWIDLGLQLKLSPSTLDNIAADNQTSDDCKRVMLRKWLQSDPEASWERLAAALTLTGHATAAAVIRRQFSLIITKDEDTTEEDKIRLILTRKNLNKIKGQFSSLLLKVQSALKSHHVSIDNVRNFLVHYFARSDWIHDPSNLDELFTALSVTKLWSYDHYDPLEEILKQFLADDDDVKKFISDYKYQLTGFYTTTKIADYIKLSDFKENDYEQDVPQQPLPKDRFTLKDYRKLKLKLKLDRKISAPTLSYVDELWRSLAEEFDLPCLTAVIHSIIEGSLVVTWLVLPHVAERIMANSSKATKFFRHHRIFEVVIDEHIIYDEEQVVMLERELFSICDGLSHVSRIGQLLSYGVDLDILDEDGCTPLFRASMRGSTDVVKTLLHYGANVNQHSNDEQNDTSLTIMKGHMQQDCGGPPLAIACVKGHTDTAKVLLDHGAVVDQPNSMGQSPLYLACEYKQMAAVKLLLEYRADVNLPTKDASGSSPLFCACWRGCAAIVRLLLDHGANIDSCNLQGVSPLCVSSQEGHLEIVQMLLERGASVNLDGPRSALFCACSNDQVETVHLLLKWGAKTDASSLYIASNHGFTKVVKVLLDYGAQVNEVCSELELPKTALHAACITGHSQVARLLIENGAIINAQTEDGYTPLHLACINRRFEIIDILLSAGAMPDIMENGGFTSLMLVADKDDSTDIIAALIEAKADPNVKDRENGRTALWYAAAVGNIGSVEILLENGAIVGDRDKFGLSSYDIASINSHPNVCYLLEQYGYQPHLSSHSVVSSSGRASPPRQPRQRQHDKITRLETFRAILEHGSSQSQDDASLKHQTSHMSEESEDNV